MPTFDFRQNLHLHLKHCLNAFPYLGKNKDRPTNVWLGEYVLLKLLEPYRNSGLNVTTNNYFSTQKISNILVDVNISLVWTIRPNRREIPPSSKINDEIFSRRLYWHIKPFWHLIKPKNQRSEIWLKCGEHRDRKGHYSSFLFPL